MSDIPSHAHVDTSGATVPDSDADRAQQAIDGRPRPTPPRERSGAALRDALKAKGWADAWSVALAAESDDTRAWWTSGYRDQIPETAKKLVRVAGRAAPPIDVTAWFDATPASAA